MAANSNIQLTSLDFDTLKTNFLTYLQSQDTFKDYNFQGSALNTLVDLLTYNTQYNSYYLNMVANEMFLDSAVQRSSVISHAKLLNYTPKSAIAPMAKVNITFNNVTSTTLTLPALSSFTSSAINGTNYNFVNIDSQTVAPVNNQVVFQNVILKQGTPARVSYTVNSSINPNYLFSIPDSTIDTTTLKVVVQSSTSNTSFDIYNAASNYLTVDGNAKVYFLQESLNGNYEIYFGDGILGKKLNDGNIITISYLSTEGTASIGANSFVLMNTVGGLSASAVNSVSAASQGADKESITSIKYHAPKSYAAQGRAVTKNDYITAIQQNKLGYTFDAVNVWGGEENDPPVYGQVFVSLKPKGFYGLSTTQKQDIVQNVIKPISMLTVTPTLVDPDYTYIKLTVNVVYDTNLTTLAAAQIKSGIISSITNFASTNLNTFNSTFNGYTLLQYVNSTSQSIVNSEYKVQLQKKFSPNLNSSVTYNLYYNTPLQKGSFLSGVSSSPAIQFLDPNNSTNIIDGVYIEEIPTNTSSVDSISIVNPGFGYQVVPIVTITGDGTGATAHAVLVNGSIQSIIVDTPGTGYTAASVVITPQDQDTTGRLGLATVNLNNRYGTLRTYYNNVQNAKVILNQNAGQIDYLNGVITLSSFGPYQIDNSLGVLAITANPTTSIISSNYNRIITIDPNDSAAITVNVTAKS
jgi:hypothetical protein